MSTDSLQETIRRIVKTFLLEFLILLFLKCGGEWILKLQSLTIMAITVMKSSQKKTKTYNIKDLIALSWR